MYKLRKRYLYYSLQKRLVAHVSAVQ